MKQIRWIWSLTKKKRGMILGLLVLVSVIAVFQVCLAVAVQLIVDKAQGKGAAPLSFLMTAVVLTGLVSMLLDGIKLYLQNNSILSLDGRLREKLLIHMEKIPVEKSQSYHSGDMLTRLTEDSAQSARVIPESIVNMAAGIFSFLFAFAYAFLINWKIALALVLLSPLPVIFSNFLMPALQKWTLKAKDGEGKVRGYLQEQLATLVTIKCFSCYEKSAQDFSQLFGDKKKKQLKSVKIQAVMNAGSGFLGIMINFAAIGLGAWYVIRGEMSIGAVLGLVQVSNYISWPFIQMIPLIGAAEQSGLYEAGDRGDGDTGRAADRGDGSRIWRSGSHALLSGCFLRIWGGRKGDGAFYQRNGRKPDCGDFRSQRLRQIHLPEACPGTL